MQREGERLVVLIPFARPGTMSPSRLTAQPSARQVLQADQQREQEKEDLRQEFSHAAAAMERFAADNRAFVKSSTARMSTDNMEVRRPPPAAPGGVLATPRHAPNRRRLLPHPSRRHPSSFRPARQVRQGIFGFTLAQVQAFGGTLSSEAAAVLAESDGQLRGCAAVLAKLEAHGTPVANPYTAHDVASLEGVRGALSACLDEQRSVFDTELERQQRSDALCLEFAETVDAFVASIREFMKALTSPEDSLEDQLKVINDALAKAENEPVRAKLRELSAQMDAAGCTFNPHVSAPAQRRHATSWRCPLPGPPAPPTGRKPLAFAPVSPCRPHPTDHAAAVLPS